MIKDAAQKTSMVVRRLLLCAMWLGVLSAAIFLGKRLMAGDPANKSSVRANDDRVKRADCGGAQDVDPDARSGRVSPRAEAISVETQLAQCVRERASIRKQFDEAVLAYKAGDLTWSQLFEAYGRWSAIEQAYCQLLFYSQLTHKDLVKVAQSRSFTAVGTDNKGRRVGAPAEMTGQDRNLVLPKEEILKRIKVDSRAKDGKE